MSKTHLKKNIFDIDFPGFLAPNLVQLPELNRKNRFFFRKNRFVSRGKHVEMRLFCVAMRMMRSQRGCLSSQISHKQYQRLFLEILLTKTKQKHSPQKTVCPGRSPVFREIRRRSICVCQ